MVVSVRSRSPSSASISISRSRFRRSSGSPPVSRIFSTPCSLKIRASRVDLLEAEHFAPRQELVVGAEDLLRHAVRAAEVAAVGDRDPQVAQRPRERVDDPARRCVPSPHVGQGHCAPCVDERDDSVRHVGLPTRTCFDRPGATHHTCHDVGFDSVPRIEAQRRFAASPRAPRRHERDACGVGFISELHVRSKPAGRGDHGAARARQPLAGRTLGAARMRSRRPRGAEPRLLAEDSEHAQWLHPGFAIELHRDEADGYYLNLTTETPYVFVNWRMVDDRAVPKIVTVSYHEAGRMMDGGEQVDGVPLPPGALRLDRRVRARALPARREEERARSSRRRSRARSATVTAMAASTTTLPLALVQAQASGAARRDAAGAGAGCTAAAPPPAASAAPPAMPAAADGARAAARSIRCRGSTPTIRDFLRPEVDPATQQRGAEEALRRSAFQPDGRAGHLHRRLHAGRTDSDDDAACDEPGAHARAVRR